MCIFPIFYLHTHKDTHVRGHTHIQTYILELSNERLRKQLTFTQDCVGRKACTTPKQLQNTNIKQTLICTRQRELIALLLNTLLNSVHMYGKYAHKPTFIYSHTHTHTHTHTSQTTNMLVLMVWSAPKHANDIHYANACKSEPTI